MSKKIKFSGPIVRIGFLGHCVDHKRLDREIEELDRKYKIMETLRKKYGLRGNIELVGEYRSDEFEPFAWEIKECARLKSYECMLFEMPKADKRYKLAPIMRRDVNFLNYLNDVPVSFLLIFTDDKSDYDNLFKMMKQNNIEITETLFKEV